MAEPAEVDQSRSGQSVRLEPGSELVVRLFENPTAGFRWSVRSDGAPVVELLESLAGPAGSLPGAGRDRRFRFRAREPGTARLELAYARPWNESAPPASTFELEIRVG